VRNILDHLPHVLLPDPARESDDPGVARDRLEDDLVRPAAEHDLARGAARGRRSPLARHVVHPVGPIDPALPFCARLRLAVEGVRVTNAHFDVGYLHQGLERRAVGLDVDTVEPWRLVARAEPPALPQITLSLALERLAGVTPPERARALRGIVVDLVAVQEALFVLGAPALRAPRLQNAVVRIGQDVDALFQGVVEGDTLAAIGGVRRDLHRDERAALLRLLPAVRRDIDALALDEVVGLSGVGVLSRAVARAAGVDGAAGRAAGLADDTPCDLAFAGGSLAEERQTGCTLARLQTRLADAHAALGRVEATLRELPDGPIRASVGALPDGVAHGVLRGPAGSWCVLVAAVGSRLVRLRLRPPELASIAAIPRALIGVPVDAVASAVASFGLRASALDR
jgi:NADH-quinone oxidoreductase subunit D